MEKATLSDKYLTFSEESKKLLTPEIIELMIHTFNKAYPAICDFFNNGELRNVVLDSDPNCGTPSLFTITDDEDGSMIENNTIKFNPNDIVFKKELGWGFNWLPHELIHVAQDYQYGNSGRYPSWIVEGLADYGQEKFGLYNKESGWKIYRVISNKKTYENGYTITAGFFIWIEENFYTALAKDLNNTLKSCKYNDNYFIEKTGRTVDELWQMYVEENRVHAITWIEEYIGASLPKVIHDKIKSGELDDELDNYLLEKTGRVIDDIWEIYVRTNK